MQDLKKTSHTILPNVLTVLRGVCFVVQEVQGAGGAHLRDGVR